MKPISFKGKKIVLKSFSRRPQKNAMGNRIFSRAQLSPEKCYRWSGTVKSAHAENRELFSAVKLEYSDLTKSQACLKIIESKFRSLKTSCDAGVGNAIFFVQAPLVGGPDDAARVGRLKQIKCPVLGQTYF